MLTSKVKDLLNVLSLKLNMGIVSVLNLFLYLICF
jgi:hypothetical protein